MIKLKCKENKSLELSEDTLIIRDLKDTIIFALHGFIKKTQKTPLHDINLALLRKKEVDRW